MMKQLHIKGVPESTTQQLSERATQLGYTSREDYLRDVLDKVAHDELIYHSDARYEIAMTKLVEQIKVFGDILYLNVQLGLLRSPFEFDQDGNVVHRKTYAEILAEQDGGE